MFATVLNFYGYKLLIEDKFKTLAIKNKIVFLIIYFFRGEHIIANMLKSS